jgi:hypothetical protein
MSFKDNLNKFGRIESFFTSKKDLMGFPARPEKKSNKND